MSIFDRHVSTDEVIQLIEAEPLWCEDAWYPEDKLTIRSWFRDFWSLFTNPKKLHEKVLLRYRQRIISTYMKRATNHIFTGTGTLRDRAKTINEYLAATRYLEMYSRLAWLGEQGLSDSPEADEIRDEIEIYWYASHLYGSEETQKRIDDMSVWLNKSLNPTLFKSIA